MEKKIKSIYLGFQDTYENSDANMFDVDIKDIFNIVIIEPYEEITLTNNELRKTKYCKQLRIIFHKSADKVIYKDKDKVITLFDRILKHNDLFSVDFYDENNKLIDGFQIPWDSMYNKKNNPFQKSKKHLSFLELTIVKQDVFNQDWLDDYYSEKIF